jgi:hypothetical protein
MKSPKHCRIVGLIALIIFVIVLSGNPAQAFQEIFQKRYDVDGSLYPGQRLNACETFDGGIVTAYTQNLGWPNGNLVVMKTDACGVLQSQISYAITGNPSLWFYNEPAIIMESVGVGYVIAGTIRDFLGAYSYPFIMKIDYSWNVLWFERFGTGFA